MFISKNEGETLSKKEEPRVMEALSFFYSRLFL